MRIPQLSIFIENKPGHLVVPCRVLAEAGINIVTLALADTEQFGIVRVIVRDWQRAREVLEGAGFVVAMTEVLAIEVTDQPGGLAGLLGVFEEAGLNVEYMYAFASNRAVLVFRFTDLDAAISALTHAGINPVSPIDLYDHLEEA